MATYHYLKPGEALARAHESARDFEKIIGLRGIDADQLRPQLTRTRAGYLRKPDDPWRAYGDRRKMRKIVSVVRTGGDSDPGTITVTFRNDDGTEESTYLHAVDLLCVERPVGPLYEKCADCHLFIEPNSSAEDDPDVAAYDHLTRGDESDGSVAENHDARPSGQRESLEWWRENGPAEMVARFD